MSSTHPTGGIDRSQFTVEQRLTSIERSIGDLFSRTKPLADTLDSVRELRRSVDELRRDPPPGTIPVLDMEQRELARRQRELGVAISDRLADISSRLADFDRRLASVERAGSEHEARFQAAVALLLAP